MTIEDAAGGVLQRDALIGLHSYWRQKKYAYDAGSNLEYWGFNSKKDALSSEGTWVIWKATYTGSDLTSIDGPITGIWDNRATLDW